MNPKVSRRRLLQVAPALALRPRAVQASSAAAGDTDPLFQGFLSPGRSFRPHTRWWWPGNALTPADIRKQLRLMRAQNVGGVEIMTTWRFYQKGAVPYLSKPHLALLKLTADQARRLDMEVAITFGSGWTFGGDWVAPEDRSKCLVCTWFDVEGGKSIEGRIPEFVPPSQRLIHHEVDPNFRAKADDEDLLLAVVAAPITGGDAVDVGRAQVLPFDARAARVSWQAPAGRWRVFGFRLRYTGQQNSAQNETPEQWVVDHLNPAAMDRYSLHLAQLFRETFGDHLGTTIDSFFCDSFEVVPLPGSILWTNDLLDAISKRTGQDARLLLPALWQDGGPATNRIRHDVNETLHLRGLASIATFREHCAALKVQARVQPHYRFVEELVQGAGMADRPETEVTTARYQTVEDPRKATVSGSRYYGRAFTSAEAFTFIHKDRYRTTLQDMKIATDAFLRDGVTQFYNHGFLGSPEARVAPSRDMPWGSPLNHWAPWWPHYHHLANYTARSSFLLRQGDPVSDVAIFSPQASHWSRKAVWNIERRFVNYGGLGDLLVRAGYDYEVINDDVLLNHSEVTDRALEAGPLRHHVVLLPSCTVMRPESLAKLVTFAERGGLVVALGNLPRQAPGLKNAAARDREVQAHCQRLFGPKGLGLFLPAFQVPERSDPAPWTKEMEDVRQKPGARELVDALERHLAPDVRIPAGPSPSEGVAFSHRRVGTKDLYFFTNLSATPFFDLIRLRTPAARAEAWDPAAGTRSRIEVQRSRKGQARIPVALEPWQSMFLLTCETAEDQSLLAAEPVQMALPPGPALLERPVTGWRLRARGRTMNLPTLACWSTIPALADHSGEGVYETQVLVDGAALHPDVDVWLHLGEVGDVAEVSVGGRRVATAWMAPHKVRLTGALRKGRNLLQIVVTNTLANRVRGLPSSEVPLPSALRTRLGATAATYQEGDKAFLEKDVNSHPARSGLLGPVKLVVQPRPQPVATAVPARDPEASSESGVARGDEPTL